MHFSLLLKGLRYEFGLWEGYKVLLILFQRRTSTQNVLVFFLFAIRSRRQISSRFLPHAFCCSTSSPKKITLVVPFLPLHYFQNTFGNILHWAIISGFKPCLSKDRGHLNIFSTSLCLLFALKVSMCARKNILSMLYME